MKFELLKKKGVKPSRVVILGSSGIISKNLQKKLIKKKFKFSVLGKKKLDLTKKYCVKNLKDYVKDGDTIIFISAEAPVKNIKMSFNNIKMCKNVCQALKNKKLENLIYLSSDAVYSDVRSKIKENSLTKPNSLHGQMHIKREKILRSCFKKKICILRPTLIYGPGDTHNGYGPNQFLSLSMKKKNITIFGNGEEKRDHIYIEDVIYIIMECLTKKGKGIINVVTGQVSSFRKIAKLVNKITKNKKIIKKLKRNGPMPHNGYRPFNNSLLKRKFTGLKIRKIESGIQDYFLKKKI